MLLPVFWASYNIDVRSVGEELASMRHTGQLQAAISRGGKNPQTQTSKKPEKSDAWSFMKQSWDVWTANQGLRVTPLGDH